MYPLTRNWWIGFATAGTLALTVASVPANADEFSQNLGPVGPNEPILTTVGSKRVIAFYVPSSDNCDLQAVVWDNRDVDNDMSAARVRVSLKPGQIVHIDTPEQESVNLQCGDHGETLAVADPN